VVTEAVGAGLAIPPWVRWLSPRPRTLAHRQHGDAEDVVQEAFLCAFRYLDKFRGEKFRSWLLTIVRNSFLDWVKDNRSGPSTLATCDADLEWTNPNPSPEALGRIVRPRGCRNNQAGEQKSPLKRNSHGRLSFSRPAVCRRWRAAISSTPG
jgi:RNA polymerase sigma factor (sigma-70 family)